MVVITEVTTQPRRRRRRGRRMMVTTQPQVQVQRVVRAPRQRVVLQQAPNPNRTARNRRRRQRRAARRAGMVGQTVVDGQVPVRYRDAPRNTSGYGWSATGPPTAVANTWSENGNDYKTVEGLAMKSLGMTENGRKAAIKALHPACVLAAQRWPDKAANDTLVMQNTDTWILNNNGVIPEGEDTYNLVIWLTNFVDCPVIAAAFPVGGIGTTYHYPWPDPSEIMNQDTSSVGQVKSTPEKNSIFGFFYSSQWAPDPETKKSRFPNNDYQQARLTARSLTVDLISNATTNQGMIYAVQFSPNMMLMPEVGGPGFSEKVGDVATEWLTKGDGRKMVIDLIADVFDLRPPPKVDEEADAVEELTTVFDKTSFADPPNTDKTGYRLVFQDWPCNPQQVMQAGPGSYSAKAQEGCYVPLKHASDTLEYRETASECLLSAVVPHTKDNQTSGLNVLHSEGWNMAAIVMAGLHKSASVNLKCITALELTTRSDSQMAKFVEEAPPLDKVAQQHCRAAMGNMADAYPAEYNGLGKILESIAGALETAGIPIVSSVAGFARKFNDMTGGVATKWLDSIF